MFRAISILVLALAAFTTAVEFTDCGSEVGKFSDVKVTDCKKEDEKCSFKVGSKPNITITFETNEDVKKVQSSATAQTFFNFNLAPPEEACSDPKSGLKCPLKKGQCYTYVASTFIQSLFSGHSAIVKVQLKNEKNKKIVCLTFPMQVPREEEKKEKPV